MNEIVILKNYKEWIEKPQRKFSGELDFGVHWEMAMKRKGFPTWRVSWIEKTGELYAVRLDTLDEFFILGKYPTREEVENAMSGWADMSSPKYMSIPLFFSVLVIK